MEQERPSKPNSLNPNPPKLNLEPLLKLPLAPMASTPRNATAFTRRGSAIFSPSQTLNHHPPPPHHHHHLDAQPLHIGNAPSPHDPDPISESEPVTTGDSSQPQGQEAMRVSASNSHPVIRYKECLKNHAANIGAHALDGCGEFMPGGEDGTPESLRCAACDCHRNFHRKVEQHTGTSHGYTYNHNSGNTNVHRPLVLQSQTPPAMLHHRDNKYPPGFSAPSGAQRPVMVAFGGGSSGGGTPTESSSEDFNMFQSGHVGQPQSSGSKKRFRTKFSQGQKEKMHEFATKLDWRIQRQDEDEVQRFCNEVGVKRQVFKVWMHNNKQAMKRKQ